MGGIHSTRCKKNPSSSAEVRCSLIMTPEPPAAAAPSLPSGRARDPPRAGLVRPRSHRQAEPESRARAREGCPAREGSPARSALSAPHRQAGKAKPAQKKRGEKPQTPLGFLLQPFLSVPSQLPFEAEPRPPKTNSKSTSIRARPPSQTDSSSGKKSQLQPFK